jgi:DNA transformation protein and related proteins
MAASLGENKKNEAIRMPRPAAGFLSKSGDFRAKSRQTRNRPHETGIPGVSWGVPSRRPEKGEIRSLASSRGFVAFVLDQLAELGGVTSRAMFGGTGLYRGDLFFGIVARDVLYLKADDRTRPAFERAGSQPFKPYSDRPATMQYYEVPLAVLEDAGDLRRWAKEAVGAAGRARSRAPKRLKRTLIK